MSRQQRVCAAALGAAAAALLAACTAPAAAPGGTATGGTPHSSAPPSAASAPTTASTSAGASAKAVPLTVVKKGQATLETVPVYVDGRGPYKFLLDTGSSNSSVSSKLAATLHLPKTGATATVQSVTNSQKVPIVSIKTWKVGTVTLAADQVPVLDSTSGIGSVSGLLGSDELSRFGAVTVDFQHDRLELTPR